MGHFESVDLWASSLPLRQFVDPWSSEEKKDVGVMMQVLLVCLLMEPRTTAVDATAA